MPSLMPPKSIAPFTKGQTVIEVMKDRDQLESSESKEVKVIWHGDDTCRTESGFEYDRDTGMETPRDQRIYRAIHSPAYANEGKPT